ncbi:Uncharacterized protein HZ326_27388 [Fusarium oxysporum f. sp. albedinis]|nr:Uncharacterized protein HZ326_27388 [Fusarium oxysporum f. sp. albedinis]
MTNLVTPRQHPDSRQDVIAVQKPREVDKFFHAAQFQFMCPRHRAPPTPNQTTIFHTSDKPRQNSLYCPATYFQISIPAPDRFLQHDIGKLTDELH